MEGTRVVVGVSLLLFRGLQICSLTPSEQVPWQQKALLSPTPVLI